MASSRFHPDLRRAARLLPRRVPQTLLEHASRVASTLTARRRPPDDVQMVRVAAASVRLHGTSSSNPARPPSPALLWMHGGGFTFGSAAQDDAFCRLVARELGIIVAAVDYRLAPEHPFPTPLEDCHDALVWLAQRADVDDARIAVGGASAGGALAAALVLLCRERGQVAPAFQLLSYPMLDDRTTLRTDVDEQHLRLWDVAANRRAWEAYLEQPPGHDDVPELAAPARAETLDGLPPAWIGVAALDLLHDEGLAYANRLRAAGVACETDVVPGAFHGFDSVCRRASVSADYRAAQIDALRRAGMTGREYT
jgi:acetyl esterase/lipase